MASAQIRTYHLAPNFSIPPSPAGQIKLGSIVKNLQNVDVLNDECHVEIPEGKIIRHQKRGFRATYNQMIRGEYGIWARFFSAASIGGEISLNHMNKEEITYQFRSEDTEYFTPTTKYIKESMNMEDVNDWLDGANYIPVYMVTGLKIARGPSISITRDSQWKPQIQLGVNQPCGVPIDIGPRAGLDEMGGETIGWEDSDDFIVGIRVVKVIYKKALLSRKRGPLQAEEYNDGLEADSIV
ncbi:hypothetical protein ONZ43_g1362 [Nemania bipapillata]|uniref:Uncharacterized protein n=1 Tax=Nemania bipapillata TaxID=110536 RepID=A0ACC2J4M8_9PEZI|nr:hypothetical protein ONZ43_g1362 [Nemania bipapillata]